MRTWRALLIAIGLSFSACAHELQVVNLQNYIVTNPVGNPEVRPRVAIRPFSGKPEDKFYHFALAQQVGFDPYYQVVDNEADADFLLTLEPSVRYRSSLLNLPIMFPGFLAFTPAWHGYVYRAEIETRYDIRDRHGKQIGGENLPVAYDIRHADMPRTALANFGWFPLLQPLPLVGGIYDAIVFDDAITGRVENAVRENYGRYVYRQIGADLARVPR
jgi:hypothetical protein